MPSKAKSRAKATPKWTPGMPDTSNTETPDPELNGKKRKIDWATIDDQSHFEGFTLVPTKPNKAPKKSTPVPKKQKTGRPSSAEVQSYKDAPLDADIAQKNPFPAGKLSDTYYKVEPALEWESTQRYRKFTSKFGPTLPSELTSPE